MLKYIIISLRIQSWIKNTFIFAALIFSKQLFVIQSLTKTIIGFILLSLISSAGYLINDMIDFSKDKKHPSKYKRPIASGRLPFKTALYTSILLFAVSLSCGFWLNKIFGVILITYFVSSIVYSLFLKHIVILDVFVIAGLFILRVMSGGIIIQVDISPWLFLCTGLISLFLGFTKRRQELILLGEDVKEHRKVLTAYSPYFLDQVISVVTTATFITYIMYTISQETINRFGSNRLIFTIPFVLYGILRYLYLIHQRKEGEDPARLLFTDKMLLVNTVLWILASVMIIYYSDWWNMWCK